jgi:hypothetical protein
MGDICRKAKIEQPNIYLNYHKKSSKENDIKKPNIKYYKQITNKCQSGSYEINSSGPFEVFKLESYYQENNFYGGYLATGNNETKNIDIYKINSKDNIELIHTIQVQYATINTIKYFYDPFNDINYLTALINNKTRILIWKILNENKYKLILNLFENVLQGGIGITLRPRRYDYYYLLFDKGKSILVFNYKIQSGCMSSNVYLEKYDFINNKSLEKISNFNWKPQPLYKSFPVYLNKKNYMAILNISSFDLIEIFKTDIKNEITKLDLIPKNIYAKNINAIITEENNEDEFLYLIYHTYYNNDVGKNILIKINLKNKENLFKTELDIDNLITISFWNKNYLLLFEIKSTIMHLFNTKTCRIEKKFINNKGNGLFTGKKLVINNNEQLLFVLDVNGNLNLWINE